MDGPTQQHTPHPAAHTHLEGEHGAQAGVLEKLLEPPVVGPQQVQHIQLGQEGQQVLWQVGSKSGAKKGGPQAGPTFGGPAGRAASPDKEQVQGMLQPEWAKHTLLVGVEFPTQPEAAAAPGLRKAGVAYFGTHASTPSICICSICSIH